MGEFLSWVIAPAHRVNICRVNVEAFKRINSSRTVADSLGELICMRVINMPIANQAAPLIRAARGTSWEPLSLQLELRSEF